ncbi:DDE-type integrase/transposase/recombinase [Streptomyces lunaelactis]|uniref:DDE-type integrase/transposase/recombinase n=1 Tax=Streptomyces lunaelactis TaxID=1535768 RepID=UPI0020C7D5C7|nr:DDE-type integrase/transposase/recombinase [Streptomyces lunaelactis]
MNTKHVGDITCLPLANGTFLYLATAIDITSRRLAGWALADQLRAELVVDALAAAERTRGSSPARSSTPTTAPSTPPLRSPQPV